MQRDVLAKGYDPKEVEEKWYTFWEVNGLFRAETKTDKKPFCIVIPPPNVTGSLHMGHALNNTLQDILCRYKRMKGCNVLWQPGTDHAGIATQNVVEKDLSSRGTDRHQIGREKFIELVCQWREKYGGVIINQLKRLGSSCDWSRERFTMDEGLSRAVKEVFVRLYDEGLIYLSKDTDLLIIECSHADDEKVEGHLTSSECGEIAKKAEVKRLLLSHLYPTVSEDRRLEECKTIFDKAELAHDLMEIKI